MNARDKITKARANLVLDFPFFGALALRLRVREDKGCGTAWTDGQDLGYSPAWIDGLSIDELKAVLAHEVLHCACGHITRRQGRKPLTWNMAADFAINPILAKSRFILPSGALLNDDFEDQAAETIYAALQKDQQRQPQGAGQGNDPGSMGEVRDTPSRGQDKGQGQGQGSAPSPAEIAQAEESWKIAVNQAAQQAKAAGNLPGALQRLINEIVNPALPWREILRQYLDSTIKADYSLFPPNRRFISRKLYLPSMRTETVGEIVVAVDTSGSINQPLLNQFAAELSLILDYMPHSTLTVIYCDTALQGVETFTSADMPLQMKPKGGGGTSFRPPFQYVGDQGITPAIFIYFTDLQCSSYPSETPPYPVLWIAYGGTPDRIPPFGEVLEIQ